MISVEVWDSLVRELGEGEQSPKPSASVASALTHLYREVGTRLKASNGLPILGPWHAADLLNNAYSQMVQPGVAYTVTPGWGSASEDFPILWGVSTKAEAEGAGVRPHEWYPYRGSDAGDYVLVPSLPLAGAELQETDHATREAVIRVALTYVEAGDGLVWKADGDAGAGLGTPYNTPKPHNITCSHFTGLVSLGIPYDKSRYVQETNEVAGPTGNLNQAVGMWQAHRQAWGLAIQGRLKAYDQAAPGDLLFWASENPEGSWTRFAQPENRNYVPYFGNVYHVALSVGGTQIIQSSHPGSHGGVYVTRFDPEVNPPTFVGRPEWR